MAQPVLHAYRGTPFETRLESAFAKISRHLPQRTRLGFQPLPAVVGAKAAEAAQDPDAAARFDVLVRAALGERTVRMRYYSIHRDAESERDLDPYGLAAVGDQWFMAGWCHVHREIRTFVVVIAPDDVRASVAKRLKEAAERYGTPGERGRQELTWWGDRVGGERGGPTVPGTTDIPLGRFWGKAGDRPDYHPALAHMIDVGLTARTFLEDIASPSMRRLLSGPFLGGDSAMTRWVPFLAALHDLGKLSPGFEAKLPTHVGMTRDHRLRRELDAVRAPHERVEWANHV